MALFVLIAVGIGLAVTTWWQLGIRYAQRHLGFDLLEPYAAETAFWMTWCVDAPFTALIAALLSLGAVAIVMVSARIWSLQVLPLLLLLPFIWFASILVNMPIVMSACD